VFTTRADRAGSSPERLRRFFNKGTGGNAGQACASSPKWRQLVKFSRLNLLDSSWPVKEPVDAIFCRNVMIYFDKPTQNKILERFAAAVEAGRAAVCRALGERVAGEPEPSSPLGQTVYSVVRTRGASKRRAGPSQASSPPQCGARRYSDEPFRRERSPATTTSIAIVEPDGRQVVAFGVLRDFKRHRAEHGAGLVRGGLSARPSRRALPA
jgi:hypothetical protein